MHHGTQASLKLFAIIFLVLVFVTTAQAAHQLSSWSWAGSGGTVDNVVFNTGAAHNDGAANGFRSPANTLTIWKTFTDPSPASLDIQFNVSGVEIGGEATEYTVVEYITNGTPSPVTFPTASEVPNGEGPKPLMMTNVTLALGFADLPLAGTFPLSPNPDGLDFDQESAGSGATGIDDPFPSSPSPAPDNFGACDLCSIGDRLFYKEGTLLPGRTATLWYQLDVPNFFLKDGKQVTDPEAFNIPDAFQTGADSYRFVLHQTAEFAPVPVPSALLLFAPALLGLLGLRKRH